VDVRSAEARLADPVAHGRAASWRKRVLLLAALVAVVAAAGGTWLKVATTMRNPKPVVVPKQPRVNALVWSHRVFVDAASFKRWLDARDVSFAEWAKQHPRALVVFHRTRSHPR
jgi:hypothetical protein